MADKLHDIISTLSSEEQRAFKQFLRRSGGKKRGRAERKDVQLFELETRDDLGNEKLSDLLYSTPNSSAYHALRKRLMRQLSEFILVKNMGEDTTGATRGIGWFYLGRHLLANGKSRLGWWYLDKAELEARRADQYELLRSVLNFKIDVAATNPEADLDDLVSQQRECAEKADMIERTAIATSLVKRRLDDSRLEVRSADLEEVITSTLERFGLERNISGSPKLLYNFASIARSIIVQRKEYYGFVPFIENQYYLVRNAEHTKGDHYYRMGLCYMCAHALYRTRRFYQAGEYLDELEELMGKASKIHAQEYKVRSLALRAAISALSGEPEEGGRMLEDALKGKLPNEAKLNMKVSLGVYRFQAGDLEGAHQALLGINHSDQWCTKIMGTEWVFKKTLMEAILFSELDEIDLAESRLRAAERNFSKLWSNEAYKRARVFLGLVRKAITDPHSVTTDEFENEVYEKIDWVPEEEEDLQAMAFYAWLKSKMTQRPYGEVLVELV